MVEGCDDAIITKDREGIITSWNPAAERMYGHTAEEAIGRPISILIPPHRRGEERTILEQILAGDRVDHYETERVAKDGRLLAVSLTVSPIRDSDGEVVRASVIARDITADRRGRELAERLQAVTSELSREITPERTVAVLLEQAVEGLGADAGAVALIDKSGTQVELAGSIGYSESGLSGWSSFPVDADLPMSVAIRDNVPVWTASPEELTSRFPPLEGAAVRFAALGVIPLSLEGKAFGAVSLSFAGAHDFDPQERAFLVAAGQQAAYALERAKLYEAQRASGERLAFLAEASGVLARSLDRDATLTKLAELAVERIADWCGIELVDDEGGLHNVAVAHVDPDRVALAHELRERYPIDPDDPTGVPAVIRSGAAELYGEVTEEMLEAGARDPEHLRLLKELGLVSAMVVPLEARGRVLGAITFVSSESGRRYEQTDLELAEDLARRAALAIDNAMLFNREHDAALTLQRSLLPQSLPEVDGARFAARYDPAAPGLEVGGDWYEVVALEDGQVAVTIGDVAGRGILAAAVMGRVRPSLRAYALDGLSPAETLERLDRAMRESERPEMSTIFHMRFDPATGKGEYVRAGHPPALIRRPDGSVELLEGKGTPPLGILDDTTCVQHPVELPPGSLLLLYTDGLIERRDAVLDVGLDRLKQALAEGPTDPQECLDSLAASFGAEAIADDVAMLAVLVSNGTG